MIVEFSAEFWFKCDSAELPDLTWKLNHGNQFFHGMGEFPFSEHRISIFMVQNCHFLSAEILGGLFRAPLEFLRVNFSKFFMGSGRVGGYLAKVKWRYSEVCICLIASAELMRWHRCPSSIKRVLSETIKWINGKFCGKVGIYHISRSCFPFFKILDFEVQRFFFIFSLTWGPTGLIFQNVTPLTVMILF